MKLVLVILSIYTFAFAITGDYLPENQTPSSTCLLLIQKENGQATCSATLVSSTKLVTAAHCVPKKELSPTTVICYDMREKSMYATHYSEVKSSHILERENDVAYIELENEINLPVMKIASKESIQDLRRNQNLHDCAVFGFGRTNSGAMADTAMGVKVRDLFFDKTYFNTRFVYNHLRKIYGQKNVTRQLQIDTYERFIQNGFNYVFTPQVHASTLTAHTSGVQPGDSGGTLACKAEDDKYTLVGIISGGREDKNGAKTRLGHNKVIYGIVVPLTGFIHDFILDGTQAQVQELY